MDERRSYRIHQQVEPGGDGHRVHCDVCGRDIGVVCSERAASIVTGWHAVVHVTGILRSA